ncbi:hydrolase [Schleiferilactobacillus harbinensis]|jgi:dihydroorotate dehydrogenase|uniref:Hydrolase n=2 Tax=Schleiferilactobacillus harbinensis TaxID=304207 RepID=A0A510TTP2_9LACO|nr:hydrolase [Schleiferilactobacillus harbinensis]HAY52911.1 hydrolase [Lactobacillus sp.]KRM23716.1 dihydrodipicolinate synthase N-acetylneuraminate lyase [Schleiferilactobacillus harbinensis DSM 16991]MBO3092945.1 hydrolase [Schleiferilactobacillus harbinensis]MCI1686819.1 hydrolase [Schleiferilactobacillus harbinensis]MCI1782694.1 hydrolase [Schleiferilactobacillus harbinensis]
MDRPLKTVPNLTSQLRQDIVESPKVIRNASGIRLFGQRIKSIVYTTDVAVIANCDADAVLAVYPWTPNTRILDAISRVSNVPILAGIGGGLTKGLRSATVGRFAEENGAQAVVMNAPATMTTIASVERIVDVPIIYTVVNRNTDLISRVHAGVDAFNVAGGKDTADLVRWVRETLKDTDPNFPIIASGGRTDEQISATIAAGANAITFTAYGISEQTFHEKMEHYRDEHQENE